MTEQDRALVLESIGSAKRVQSEVVEPEARSIRPIPTQRILDDKRVTAELMTPLSEHFDPDAAEPLRYLKNGYSPKLLGKLGRGEFSVRDQIDLHHMTQAEARIVIKDFIDECIGADRLCVKIIHGKGMRSGEDGPVLKALSDRMLRQRGDVIAFRSARHNDGGSGAVIVLLKGRV
ncbi:MAG: Smr/MutS family protein [Ahniella sp.]|nr:Smr/MutS family protein [Ahniella sp.]